MRIPPLFFAAAILFCQITFADPDIRNAYPYTEFSGRSAEVLFESLMRDHTSQNVSNWNDLRFLLGGKLTCGFNDKEYWCRLHNDLSPSEVIHIYNHLQAEAIKTNSEHQNVKIVHDILFVSNENELGRSKIYLKHPCNQTVTLAQARDCISFWAREIYYSHAEDPSSSIAVVSGPSTQRLLSEAMSASGATRKQIGEAINFARANPFLGVVAEFNEDIHLYYFAIDKHNILRPLEIYRLNTSTTNRSWIKRLFAKFGMSRKDVVSKYSCAVLLGEKANYQNKFDVVVDDIDAHY